MLHDVTVFPMFPLGTIVNVAAVIVGSLLGVTFRRGLPERIKQIIFQSLGLVTILLGLVNAVVVTKPLPNPDAVSRHVMELIFAMLIGGIVGEWLGIEQRLERLADWLKAKLKAREERFTEGLITAFLIFCIGPLTIVGSLNEGMSNDHSLLFAKSILDGFMSIALASTFGIGVFFSILPLFIFQAGISLLGWLVGDVVSEVVVNQLTAVGGLLILGLGFNILGIAKMRVANLLPALVVVVMLTLAFG